MCVCVCVCVCVCLCARLCLVGDAGLNTRRESPYAFSRAHVLWVWCLSAGDPQHVGDEFYVFLTAAVRVSMHVAVCQVAVCKCHLSAALLDTVDPAAF